MSVARPHNGFLLTFSALFRLIEEDAEQDARNESGETPSSMAAKWGFAEMERLLDKEGTDKDAIDVIDWPPSLTAPSRSHLTAKCKGASPAWFLASFSAPAFMSKLTTASDRRMQSHQAILVSGILISSGLDEQPLEGIVPPLNAAKCSGVQFLPFLAFLSAPASRSTSTISAPPYCC
ncbi:hypothetical protein B0T10DRAFT_462751 [Thelonectria olida]|uniref:Uncharacterized protein n=1 Tax=Thelonectria olida TaxID=1576542 RepID=A0A9P8VZ25_9HYPO|nr:hypothetical protein B0T10DRAFT_462751 [Thelonectria olida]